MYKGTKKRKKGKKEKKKEKNESGERDGGEDTRGAHDSDDSCTHTREM